MQGVGAIRRYAEYLRFCGTRLSLRRRPITTEPAGRLPSLRGALATKQSRGRVMRPLDCFAALAMTAGSWLVYCVALDRTGLAGANKLNTVPALIRPLGVRPNRLRKEDTCH